MCGIVGYIGEKNSTQILMEGLRKLEYRGYDSAGLAIFNGSDINLIRRCGHLEELENAVNEGLPQGNLGIGHTRWATHGKPCEKNAHPHLDCTGKIALVHNGIIENYLVLRESLESRGHTFRSETDTEVIVHLVEESYDGDLVSAVRKAVRELEGSFAIAVISIDNPDLIVAARVDSPLILGLGEEEYFVASDIPAILSRTRKVLLVENEEIAKVTRNGIELTTFEGSPVTREIFEVKWDAEAAEKGGYEDFMLKEIFEQPVAIRETLRGRVTPDNSIIPDEISLTEEEIKNLNKVFIIACGTSFHAGLVAKYAIEKWARLPVETEISSEFRYRDPVVDSKTLVIAITQSGETADTLAGLRRAKKDGAKVITVSNVVGSSATREADGVF
ncbi:MAG: glutamine--fructose-6-phosphate transaminase (isomerizing), partial [Candidatus Subteraquimicrobiales bacterium]|nr:glutamine--fructose-6-phosphate transaminase (isomerizing) [Candidatus Subteraquimicrobiales bacterium]